MPSDPIVPSVVETATSSTPLPRTVRTVQHIRIFFGFSGTMPDGDAFELIFQYATLIEDRIISIVTTAYNEGGCPGRNELGGFQTAQLAEFRPHLEAMPYESPLPELDR